MPPPGQLAHYESSLLVNSDSAFPYFLHILAVFLFAGLRHSLAGVCPDQAFLIPPPNFFFDATLPMLVSALQVFFVLH